MVIDRKGGERRNIDTELLPLFDLRRQFGIKPVYAFDKQNGTLFHSYGITAVSTTTCFEIICRQSHFLSAKNSVEIGIELLKIKSIQTLVVIVAAFVARSKLPVDKIIVKRNHLRLKQICHKLYRQSLGSRGLA